MDDGRFSNFRATLDEGRLVSGHEDVRGLGCGGCFHEDLLSNMIYCVADDNR
jgi:hypothetical protein